VEDERQPCHLQEATKRQDCSLFTAVHTHVQVRSVSVPGRQGSSWEGGRQGAVIYEVRLVMAW
jgi:hypothetical protein